MNEKGYNEDIDRLSEGLREYLADIDISYIQKYEALKIVMNNFKSSMHYKQCVAHKAHYIGTVGLCPICFEVECKKQKEIVLRGRYK